MPKARTTPLTTGEAAPWFAAPVVDGAKRYVFDLSKDVGERNDLTNQRQDIARRLRPLIAAWEPDVDAEAKSNSGTATQ